MCFLRMVEINWELCEFHSTFVLLFNQNFTPQPRSMSSRHFINMLRAGMLHWCWLKNRKNSANESKYVSESVGWCRKAPYTPSAISIGRKQFSSLSRKFSYFICSMILEEMKMKSLIFAWFISDFSRRSFLFESLRSQHEPRNFHNVAELPLFNAFVSKLFNAPFVIECLIECESSIFLTFFSMEP